MMTKEQGVKNAATGCRGRRPDPEKRAQIIAAALELFAAYGFSVSVGKIAEVAGVSKQTIYNLFGTKQNLFSEVVRQCSQEIIEAIPTEPTDQPIAEALKDLAMNFMGFMTTRRIPNVYRLMFQAPENVIQELTEAFYEIGPAQGLKHMTLYLEALHKKGVLNTPDPALAAEAFFGILKGHIFVQNMLGIRQKWSKEELQRRADYCVALFLKYHLPASA